MSKDPAFLFYPSDFLTGTMFLSNEQVGAYIRLLCAQHQQGHLPQRAMEMMCGGIDEEVFSKFEQDEKGLYYNQRLDNESERRTNYVQSRRKNLACEKKEPDNLHMDSHMETVTIYTNSTDNKTNKPISNTVSIPKRFEALWSLYPKKQGKTDALNAYRRALKDGVTDEQIKTGIEAYVAHLKANGTEMQYIKMGGTFFNQRCWNDDYTIQKKVEPKKVYTDTNGSWD